MIANDNCEITNKQPLVEINPEYLYLTIPSEWLCIYHKLLVYMSDFGKTIIDDCTASCKGSGKNIISCWNLFQSALACRQLGYDDKANFFIDYIDKQLYNIYKTSENTIYNGTNYYPITPDGKLKALCSCVENNNKFYVDIETGKLYEEFLNSSNNGVDFSINEDNNLQVTSENRV